ncbi:MAG: DUF309 domain-containing protein [Dehalococcoidia bacterium]|nr:DUF309 domain-containing protein [Dehalococcoidia bacterium]
MLPHALASWDDRPATPARKPRLQPGVERPRDRFGRPLPWDAETELELLDYDSLSIEENQGLAIESFNEGVYFSAHEAWEGAWRQARGTADEEILQGPGPDGRRLHPHATRQPARRAHTPGPRRIPP